MANECKSVKATPGGVWAAHIAPFAMWLLIMKLLGDPSVLKYGLQTVLGLGLLLYFRPWRWYDAPRVRHLVPGFVIGLLVYVVWVLPEQPFLPESLRKLYLSIGTIGTVPEPPFDTPYRFESAGMAGVCIRLVGSAFIISIIEEFFWRGFIQRWAHKEDFIRQDPGQFHVWAFVLVCLVFGLEHMRWLTGFLAGLAYGGLYIRYRNLWPAVIAHITTNLVLGLHVLATGQYQFWL